MIGTYLRLALRNILKNRRRSLVTITASALGFASLTLFAGYVSNTFKQLALSASVQEGLGHLAVYKRGWHDQGTLHPEKFLLSEQEIQTIRSVAERIPGVILASPKLNLSGLISNGDVSTIFIAEGVEPKAFNQLIRTEGSLVRGDMDPSNPDAVHVSEELARLLGLTVGSKAMLAGATLQASMNAVNIEVKRLFNTGVPDTNDKYVRIPLQLAQTLLDAPRADRIMIMARDFESVPAVREQLAAGLSAAGVDTEIRNWEELSQSYTGTRDMLSMLLTFMGSIVLVIVIMSVINTMSVSVVERTREIGTLRVIGLRRSGAAKLFAAEGALLGLCGSVAGIVVHSIVWLSIVLAKPMYTPPGVSEPVPFVVEYVPLIVLQMTGALVLFALLAAIMPARRAAKQDVVVSLGYV